MRFATFLALAALAAFVVTPNAGADHGCNGTVTDLAGRVYVDYRNVLGIDVWLYVESNGIPGLQSGGKSLTLGSWDVCAHANPDILIF